MEHRAWGAHYVSLRDWRERRERREKREREGKEVVILTRYQELSTRHYWGEGLLEGKVGMDASRNSSWSDNGVLI
jgi:hypothetical protein